MAFSASNVEIQFMLVFLVERININTSSNIKTDQAQGNKVQIYVSPSPCWFRFIMVTGWKNLQVEHKQRKNASPKEMLSVILVFSVFWCYVLSLLIE